MVGKIQSQTASSLGMPLHSGRSVRQNSHSSAQAQQAGVLQVTTAEGDVVTISFGGLQKARSDSRQSANANGYSASSHSSASASIAGGVQVQGSLSDKEVADISSLMSSLGSAIVDARNGDTEKFAADVASASSLGSVQRFQFAYQESAQSEYSSTTRLLA